MFQFAFRNLLTRPMRSLLALCGLTVAIAGMVGLFSVAEGIEKMVSTTFAKIPGLVVMQPGAPIPLFSRIPSDWGAEIERLEGVHVVSPEVWSRAHVINGKPTISPPRFLFGVDLDKLLTLRHGVYQSALQEGRFLTRDDEGTWNTVISRPIADEFKVGVGDTLRVDGQTLHIVGIYQCHSLLLDVAILLDIDHVRALARLGPESVSSFYVEADLQADRDQLADRIKEHFRGRSLTAWQPSSLLAEGMLPPSGDAGQTGTSGRANPIEAFFSSLHRALRHAAPAGETRGLSGQQPAPPQAPVPPDGPPAEDASAAPPPTQSGPESTGEASTGSAAPSAPPTTVATSATVSRKPGESPPERDPAARPAAPRPAGHSGRVADRATDSADSAADEAAQELPVEVRSSDDWAIEFKRFSGDLEIFLLIMTSIGMSIAVLGIINTMLMSVSERFIEFGILKANGWSNGSVLRLIAFESALLGIAGGVFGAALGWGATHLINASLAARVHLYASPQLLIFSLFFSTAVGVLGGLYPALWAARMMPMDAIRRG